MPATLDRDARMPSRYHFRYSPRALTANTLPGTPDIYIRGQLHRPREHEGSNSESLEERRRREDAEDRVVALPRLRRYREGRAKLTRHEDLMRELNIDPE